MPSIHLFTLLVVNLVSFVVNFAFIILNSSRSRTDLGCRRISNKIGHHLWLEEVNEQETNQNTGVQAENIWSCLVAHAKILCKHIKRGRLRWEGGLSTLMNICLPGSQQPAWYHRTSYEQKLVVERP